MWLDRDIPWSFPCESYNALHATISFFKKPNLSAELGKGLVRVGVGRPVVPSSANFCGASVNASVVRARNPFAGLLLAWRGVAWHPRPLG